MKYKTLGDTGLLVSQLCLGTMTFGGGSGVNKHIGAVDQAGADELVKASIEAGIDFFDTADVYSAGGSESTLGQSVKNLGIARTDVVLATKVFGRMGPGRNDVGASRGHILDAVEASLRRLQADHIDLYQVHATDAVTPIEETHGVIHSAFIHDFSNFKENCETDRRAIEVLGDALTGSNPPLIVSVGLHPTPGRPTTEEDEPPAHSPMPRVSEQTAMLAVSKGVRVSAVRLPQVHDRDKAGLVTYLIAHAREKGFSAYMGEGLNRWPAVHRLDAARLYRLVLDKGTAGTRYHAVAEEGVPLRQIAEKIGRGLKIPIVSIPPEEAEAYFGMLGYFVQMDIAASSTLTRRWLSWHPTEKPGLLADLEPSDRVAAANDY